MSLAPPPLSNRPTPGGHTAYWVRKGGHGLSRRKTAPHVYLSLAVVLSEHLVDWVVDLESFRTVTSYVGIKGIRNGYTIREHGS